MTSLAVAVAVTTAACTAHADAPRTNIPTSTTKPTTVATTPRPTTTARPTAAPTVEAATPSADNTLRPAVPRAAEPAAPDLSAAVARAVEEAGHIDLAVSVLDLTTGARAGHQDDVPFRSASLSKLIVAVDLLTGGKIDDEDRDRLTRALSASDDDAMNTLWTLHDGIGAVRRVAELVGLTTTHAPEDASQWGDVETSADDLTRLYQYILTTLPESERDFVVTALSTAPDTAADGFDQAFGLLAPDLDAYAKQGWMWYLPAELYLHTAGVAANRYAVALLSVQSSASTDQAREQLTDVTRTLLAALA
ncbi:serine hydrolase [Actinosynnema sp. CS-041913]|uniref:serine hydrolase n=1 Tax=Actinosynnema sp. CS-041913 TaxID=3239917 RepID=UPI003D8BFFC5